MTDISTNGAGAMRDRGRRLLDVIFGRFRYRQAFAGFAATAILLAAVHSAEAAGEKAKAPIARPASIYQVQPEAERLDVKVTLHKTETIQLAMAFTEALVGNAEVADVVPLTDRTIYIVGKKVGVTRLSLLDKGKQVLGVIDVEVTYDLAGLRKRIAAAGGRGIRVESVNGKILLTGTAADAPAMQSAVALAEQIAPASDVTNAMKVAAPQQVQLEVRFIEADRTASRALGVNANIGSKRVVGVTGVSSSGGVVGRDEHGNLIDGIFNNLATGLASNAVPFGSMIGSVLAGGTRADIVVKALEEKGLARRLAEPNLVALSGDTASFLAGGEFPFPTGKDRDGNVTLEFKKFGIGLAFTPTVLSDGQINLKIEPEVSELDPSNSITVNGFNVPSLSVRRAATTVELRDGQSFAVAGLLQSRNIKNTEQLPWIGDVPVIGALLRSTAWEKSETDLVIIITPHLVRPRAPGKKLATPLDTTVSANDPEQFLAGKHEIEVRQPKPESGHIIDWSNESPIGGSK